MEENMAKKSQSIASKMNEARVIVTNVTTIEPIKTKLFDYGYDEPSLNEGPTLYDAGKVTIKERDDAFGEQLIITGALTEKSVEFQTLYMDHYTLAKVAMKNNLELQKKIGIHEPRERRFAYFLKQARKFYDGAINDPEIMALLAKVGLTVEKLQTGLTLLEEVEELDAQQEDKKGQVKLATEKRDEALEKLFDWISDLIRICRVAFRDDPQTLERLGIKVPG
jgi:hypothetical protein